MFHIDTLTRRNLRGEQITHRASTSLLLRYACGDGFRVDVTCNEVGCIYVPGCKYIYHANEYAASDNGL